MKEAARLTDAGDDAAAAAAPEAEEEAPPEKPVLKFRNYVVKDQTIEHEMVSGGRSNAARGGRRAK